MDEIEKRLRETSENCFNCYEKWQKAKKDPSAREALLEAIHEIRKVASRLEIELAVSERDEMAQKPIPIPPHRDARRRPQENFDENDAAGNRAQPDENDFQGQGPSHQPPPRNPQGGGGHQGGHRRNNNRPQRRSAEG